MIEADEKPTLHFFRVTPDRLMSRPPWCSSIQNLELCFYLIALGRFPHALTACASSIESAIKSTLNISPEQFTNAEKLFKQVATVHPALSSFNEQDLKSFRFTRNRIMHYGFSPRDDEETATLLLKIGFPFLMACYKEFFNFDLLDDIAVEFGRQLRIALDVYQQAKDIPDLKLSYCFLGFGHLIRWRLRQSLMGNWEIDASEHWEEIGAKFDASAKMKRELELMIGAAWSFDCPVCDEIDTFVCEIDEDRLDDRVVSLRRGMCASCGFVVPRNCPFLVDALCREQIPQKRDKILRDAGITDAQA